MIGQRCMSVSWVLERTVTTRRLFRVLTTYAQGKISLGDDVARGYVSWPLGKGQRCVITSSDNDMDPRPRLYVDEH